MSENKESSSFISYPKIILLVAAMFALLVPYFFIRGDNDRKSDEFFLRTMEKQFHEVNCECQPAVAGKLLIVFEFSLICGHRSFFCSREDYSEDLKNFIKELEMAWTEASAEACKAAADEERRRDTQIEIECTGGFAGGES